MRSDRWVQRGGMPSGVRRLAVSGCSALVVAMVLGLGGPVAGSAGAATAPSTEILSGVSCTGALCSAVGTTNPNGGSAVIVESSNHGSAWAADKPPAGVEALNGVSCPGSKICVAVGETGSGGPAIAGSPTSGTKWKAQTPPAADGDLTAVFCLGSEKCWAGGYNPTFQGGVVAHTTDGGTTWQPQNVPSGTTGDTGVGGIDCAGSGVARCYAAGFLVHYFQYPFMMEEASNQTSWTSQPVESSNTGTLSGVTCWSSLSCIAVGTVNGAGYVMTTTDGGTTWTPAGTPSGFTGLSAISCPASSTCFAVGSAAGGGGGIAVTTTSGSSWAVQAVPAGSGALTSVSCVSTTHCVAVGSLAAGGPEIVSTGNGGGKWVARAVPA